MTNRTHTLELERGTSPLNEPTAQATCTCGWKGTTMRGEHRDTAARMQHDSHLANLITDAQPSKRSPEAEEAQAELQREQAWEQATMANRLDAQRAEVSRIKSQAALRYALAWLITMAWLVAVVALIVWAVR